MQETESPESIHARVEEAQPGRGLGYKVPSITRALVERVAERAAKRVMRTLKGRRAASRSSQSPPAKAGRHKLDCGRSSWRDRGPSQPTRPVESDRGHRQDTKRRQH